MLLGRDTPLTYQGMRIGLYGGSFNPIHEGHRHIALSSIKRLGLDQLWILVTPGNPLKQKSELRSSAERIDGAKRYIKHPKIHILDIETQLNTVFTAELITSLIKQRPHRQFIWIMGADSLGQFHRWYQWEKIVRNIEIAVFDRPKITHKALNSQMAIKYNKHRSLSSKAKGAAAFPSWRFIFSQKIPASSTALRLQIKN